MADIDGRISPAGFHACEGVEDWRVLWGEACAFFRTSSVAASASLVDAVAALATTRHPKLDLRPGGVTVCLPPDELGALHATDVELARGISGAARDLDLPADPTGLQQLNLTVDARTGPAVRPFWSALLGYKELGEDDLIDPAGRGPGIWFQPLDAPREQRNRLHVDVAVPHDQAEARVAAALAAGGRLVTDAHAPSWWVLADPEGNEACVATWVGRNQGY